MFPPVSVFYYIAFSNLSVDHCPLQDNGCPGVVEASHLPDGRAFGLQERSRNSSLDVVDLLMFPLERVASLKQSRREESCVVLHSLPPGGDKETHPWTAHRSSLVPVWF